MSENNINGQDFTESADVKRKEKKSFKQWLFGNVSKKGLYTAAVSILVAAIVIVFNLVIAQLPSSVMEFDLTGSKLYTVSDRSKEIISEKVSDDIQITILAQEDSVDERVMKFIKKYAAVSPHITVQQVDPVLHPSALETYDSKEDTVVVTNMATGKSASIDIYGFEGQSSAMLLYDYEYYYYYQQRRAVSFDCEGQLTSAIVYVVGTTTDSVYTLTGHNEEALPENMAELVEKSNLATDEIDLLVDGGIPEDCGTIVCYNPTADLSNDELTMLREFMSQGGNVILVIDSTDLKNFNSLMSDNGLELLEGYVGDESRYYTSYASYYGYYCFAPVVSASSSITSQFTQMNAMALYARGMVQSENMPENVTVTNLMTTSADGIHYIQEDVYESGQYIIGADAANSESGSHLIVFSSYYMFGDDIAGAFASLSNSNILLSAITSGFEGVESVNIGSRSLDIGYNTIKNPVPWMVLFVIIVPAAFIICGFVTWNRRRRQ